MLFDGLHELLMVSDNGGKVCRAFKPSKKRRGSYSLRFQAMIVIFRTFVHPPVQLTAKHCILRTGRQGLGTPRTHWAAAQHEQPHDPAMWKQPKAWAS